MTKKKTWWWKKERKNKKDFMIKNKKVRRKPNCVGRLWEQIDVLEKRNLRKKNEWRNSISFQNVLKYNLKWLVDPVLKDKLVENDHLARSRSEKQHSEWRIQRRSQPRIFQFSTATLTSHLLFCVNTSSVCKWFFSLLLSHVLCVF